MGQIAVQKCESFWDEIQQMEHRILIRAHNIFRDNGSAPGRDLENWLAAERELVWKPAIELKEKDDQFELRIAVAGVDPRDLDIEVTDEDLLVKGRTRREDKKGGKKEKGNICVSEFQTGTLFRSVHFPKKIDPDKVKAELRNGLVTVIAPVAEKAKEKKVKIHAA